MKKALLAVLGISFLLEAGLALGGFVARDRLITQFGLAVTDDTRFLGSVLAWMLLFTTMICGIAFAETRRGTAAGRKLDYALGFWWIGIGLSLAIGYGRLEHLVLDALKGALIVGLTWSTSRARG